MYAEVKGIPDAQGVVDRTWNAASDAVSSIPGSTVPESVEISQLTERPGQRAATPTSGSSANVRYACAVGEKLAQLSARTHAALAVCRNLLAILEPLEKQNCVFDLESPCLVASYWANFHSVKRKCATSRFGRGNDVCLEAEVHGTIGYRSCVECVASNSTST
jgi:hypothetical protein